MIFKTKNQRRGQLRTNLTARESGGVIVHHVLCKVHHAHRKWFVCGFVKSCSRTNHREPPVQVGKVVANFNKFIILIILERGLAGRPPPRVCAARMTTERASTNHRPANDCDETIAGGDIITYVHPDFSDANTITKICL